MKASSMQNHFDATRSKCRQTKPIVWATLLILMSRHADRSSSSLYLADLRSLQYGCIFATVCDRKGYGGAVYCHEGAHVNMFNSDFVNNKTTAYGGVIYQLECRVSVARSNFSHNEGKLGGVLSRQQMRLS